MKNKFRITCLLVGLAASLNAAPLTESAFTEIVKEVNVVDATSQSATPAKVNELFKSPNLVRTGRDSRTELTAPDETITRVGANSVFSFEPVGRTLQLEQGNVLFHSPAGKGGGTIKSHSVSAAVLGTTLIVSATADGGIKVILLEGKGLVTLPNGETVSLKEGQMVYVQPGGKSFSRVLDINLEKLVNNSFLIKGYARQLPSLPAIQGAIHKQKVLLAGGEAVDTGVSANKFASSLSHGNALNSIDHGNYQTAAPPPLTKTQVRQLVNFQDPAKPILANPGGRGFSALGSRNISQ